jgi:hypothetical protein
MSATLEGVHQRLLNTSTTATIQSAIQDATMAMAAASGISNPLALQQTLRQYAMQNEKFGAAAEMLEDVMDEDEEEESEDVEYLLGTLAEDLNLQLKFDLPTPKKNGEERRKQEDELKSLQERFEAMKSRA